MPTALEDPSLSQPRDPVLALLLSLYPGGGQIYNGHLGKALLAILFYPASLCMAPLDAYFSAKHHNESLKMLENHTLHQIESSVTPPPAVLAYRQHLLVPTGRSLPIGFYRASLFAILGTVLAATAATGGFGGPFVFGAALAGASVFLTLSAHRERRLQAERALAEAASQLQAQVIRLAARRGGRLTLGQVVESTQLGIEEASGFMESLALAGQVEFIVEEDGGLTYEFRDLLRLAPAAESGRGTEKAILAYAQKAGGRFHLGELALEVGLPLRELQGCLTRLCSDGFAHQTEDGGKTLYVFPDFCSPRDPRSSVSLKGCA
jgi:hypothetical protein